MTNYQNATELSKLTLGKSTQYCSEYTADLLQGVPRSLNRDDLALDQSKLPFIGEDVWYGYELSWLDEKGKPVVAVAEFRFSCTSENIVESKSFKLYLNSFNQTRFSSIKEVEEVLTKDLSNIAGSPAKVKLFGVDHCPALDIVKSTGNCFCIDGEDISVDTYEYNAQLLENAQDKKNGTQVEEHLVSHLLKSNCLITNQPDWASVYINYRGKAINHAVLLQYLISFRQHNEFHEQCVERIFCDLQEFCQLESLTVFARYTRRGGLDINPFRSSEIEKAPFARTLRQ
ncbi:MAG: NADPH-dependent 7-cyano-7-deazaguanine reductase QueF [Colwellia sp.]|nr:NADPH-dependent 7-cyano-7-deazaguanine reductase QueF [Colwellia sp.]